jgi:hypothetical protein
MLRRTTIVLILSLVLIASLLIAGCTSSSSEPITTTTAKSTVKPTITTSAPVNSGVQVQIDYAGKWTGALGAGGNVKTVDGTGTQVFDIPNPGYAVTVNAQKQDDSGRRLTVSILKNGKVVTSEFTDAAYGVAMTSAAV